MIISAQIVQFNKDLICYHLGLIRGDFIQPEHIEGLQVSCLPENFITKFNMFTSEFFMIIYCITVDDSVFWPTNLPKSSAVIRWITRSYVLWAYCPQTMQYKMLITQICFKWNTARLKIFPRSLCPISRISYPPTSHQSTITPIRSSPLSTWAPS